MREQHKIKVAYIIDAISTDKAGTEKQVIETLKRLDRRKLDPILICLKSTGWQEHNEIPCRLIILHFKGFLHPTFPQVLMRLRKLLVNENVDILQAFFEDALFVAFLATRAMKSAPRIVASRRDVGLGHDRTFAHLVYDVLRPPMMRRLDGILANGQAVRRFVLRKNGLSDNQVRVIHNGTELSVYPGDAPPVFEETPADIWLGLVANLNGRKRHRVLIDALVHLRQKMPTLDIKCLFLGAGDQEPQLRTQVACCGLNDNVIFEGAVANVSDYLRQIDIGVLCSEVEGFSNSIMEYMVHALPVVATNVGGNRELVDERNGRLVPVDNAVELANAIQELALDRELRSSMGQESKRRIATLCAWDQVLGELDSYYRSLLR